MTLTSGLTLDDVERAIERNGKVIACSGECDEDGKFAMDEFFDIRRTRIHNRTGRPQGLRVRDDQWSYIDDIFDLGDKRVSLRKAA